MGIPGLNATLMYLTSKDARNVAGEKMREWERDFNVSYVVQDGSFKGLGISWLNASGRGDVVRAENQNRLIFNYTLPIF